VDLSVDSILDDLTSGGREFHVCDAAAGKARSPMVRRRVEDVDRLIHSKPIQPLTVLLAQFLTVLPFNAPTLVVG